MEADYTGKFTTSDIMTYMLAYIARVKAELRRECGLTLTQYRMLAFLSDHIEGTAPTPLAKILRVSPSLVSVEFNRLNGMLLARYNSSVPERKRPFLEITKAGIDKARDADIVLAQTHDSFFESLSTGTRIVIESGSMITNNAFEEGNRMRDGHFFAAFETLHAFLIVESYLTETTHAEGLSLTEFRLLFELGERGGLARPSELADALLLTRSNTTSMLSNLERVSYVELAPDTTDRRAKSVALTAGGRRRLEQITSRVESLYTKEIRKSARSERDVYNDAATIVVANLRRERSKMATVRIRRGAPRKQ